MKKSLLIALSSLIILSGCSQNDNIFLDGTITDLGINHVQFNMVDNETLYAAQKEPEKYGELMVRIAGYSAHFVEMNKMTQDAIIARSVQKF